MHVSLIFYVERGENGEEIRRFFSRVLAILTFQFNSIQFNCAIENRYNIVNFKDV